MYKIVNLETFAVPDDEAYSLLKSEIGNASSVLGLFLLDGFLHKTVDSNIEQLSKEVDLHVVSGIMHDNILHGNVIPFDYMLHTVYNSYNGKETRQWNSSADKFLFLGGVPDRVNRIGLLNKFYKANLLEDSVWTFFKPWTTEQQTWCKNYLADNYNAVLTLERSIDNVYESSKHYGTSPSNNEWTKDIGWIDPAVFNNTLLSIVSEGTSDSDLTSRYLTEKTYRVFVQRHPFLHASNPEMFAHIKALGFKTFEEYMLIKDYAYLPSEEDRLDAIVENTKHFMANYCMYQTEIEEDIEHNYNLFYTLANKNLETLEYIVNKFNIEQAEIDKWFNQKGFHHLVRSYAS
jgi:hypothetical protein